MSIMKGKKFNKTLKKNSQIQNLVSWNNFWRRFRNLSLWFEEIFWVTKLFPPSPKYYQFGRESKPHNSTYLWDDT